MLAKELDSDFQQEKVYSRIQLDVDHLHHRTKAWAYQRTKRIMLKDLLRSWWLIMIRKVRLKWWRVATSVWLILWKHKERRERSNELKLEKQECQYRKLMRVLRWCLLHRQVMLIHKSAHHAWLPYAWLNETVTQTRKTSIGWSLKLRNLRIQSVKQNRLVWIRNLTD